MPLPKPIAAFYETQDALNRQDASSMGQLGALSTIMQHIQQQNELSQTAPLRRELLQGQIAKAKADAELQRIATQGLGDTTLDPDKLEMLGTRLALGGHTGGTGMIAAAQRLRDERTKRAAQGNLKTLLTQGGDFGPVAPDAAVGGVTTGTGTNPAGVPDDVWQKMVAADQAGQSVDVRQPAQGNILSAAIDAKVPGQVISQMVPKPAAAFADIKPVAGGYLQKGPDGRPAFVPTAQEPIVPVMGPDGKSVYASRSQAVGKTVGPSPGNTAAGMGSADFTKTGDEFLNTLPLSDQAFIRKVANYDIDPKTLSTRGGHREEVLKYASAFDPTFDQKNYNTQYNAINRFATGKQGDTVRSLNVAVEHMDTARRMGTALANGDFPLFNRVANEFATQTGKPAPTNFNAVKDIVANEVLKGTIGAAGAQQDREEFAKRIRDSSSPQQLNGVLDSWTELMGGQLKGLEKQYEGATARKDFKEKYLTPRALEAVGMVQSKLPPANPALGGGAPSHVGTGTPGDWIKRAMEANPGMSLTEVIAEGKRLKKIP